MDSNNSAEEKKRFARIRRVKWLLRPLPRRAVLHRYPFISRFAQLARKMPYLWSFRPREVVPALYAGFIIAFLPLLGIQVPIAFGAAILFRANLPITVALQFISLPFTVPIIWWISYNVGDFFIGFFGSETTIQQAEALGRSQVGLIKNGLRGYMCITVGGLILGYFSGFVSSLVYRMAAVTKASKSRSRAKSDPDIDPSGGDENSSCDKA